eukprot:11249313-Alexandrium_andersonii.AAC.1
MKDPKKFKVAGVSATVATKAQVGALLENSGWKVEVLDVRFSPKDGKHFAIVKSEREPPAYSLECLGG